MAELHTQRLTLSRPDRGDIAAIFAAHHDPRTTAHNPGDALADLADAGALFGRWDLHWVEHGFGYFTIRLRDTAAVIGFCGIKRTMFRGRRVLNLFYRLDPAFWGHGYASEAAAAVLADADETLPDLPLIARVRPQNTASRRVLATLGLTEHPELGDVGQDGYETVYLLRPVDFGPNDPLAAQLE